MRQIHRAKPCEGLAAVAGLYPSETVCRGSDEFRLTSKGRESRFQRSLPALRLTPEAVRVDLRTFVGREFPPKREDRSIAYQRGASRPLLLHYTQHCELGKNSWGGVGSHSPTPPPGSIGGGGVFHNDTQAHERAGRCMPGRKARGLAGGRKG